MIKRQLRRLARRAVFGAIAGWPLTERSRLCLEEVDIAVPGLPAGLDGLRIGLLTDLHVGWYAGPEQAIRAVSMLGAARPDLAVVAGDLVHEGTGQADLEAAARAVAAIEAPLGVCAVLGNHCYGAGASRVEAALAGAGVEVLVNRGRALAVRGSQLWLAGLDSAYAGRPDPARALPPEATGLCLLAVHEPDYADEAVRALPDGLSCIQLSGHSHGGQICLPGVTARVLPMLGRKYPRGLYRIAPDYQVYTSRGVGVTGVPVRWGSPPEVTLLRLCATSASPQAASRR